MRHSVKATREGLVGQTTASGFVIDRHVPFAALPSTEALGRFVEIFNPANGKSCLAWIADVGPWNERDDAYVLGGARPAAESGIDERGRTTNRAGIDLSEKVWNLLGLDPKAGEGLVEWQFVID